MSMTATPVATGGAPSDRPAPVALPAGQPLWTEHQHQNEDGENRRVLVGELDIPRPEGLEEAEQKPAQHGAGERAEAAEQRRGERLEARGIAHGEVHLAVRS